MGKTAAERKKEQIERLKASGKYENFKEREKNKLRERRIQKKKQMTIEEKEVLKAKKRKEMKKYRAKKALKLLKTNDAVCSESSSPSKAFQSPQSFGKAVSKVKKNLPNSPNKCKAVIKKLAQQIVPNIVQAPLPKSRISKIDVKLEEQVKAFYEKDSISYQAPGTKDFVIVRDFEGKKTKVQKKYLCTTLGEAHEMFKNDNPGIKIGRSKFSELRPSHICLRHETPANLCLCIYHENVRLLLEGISFFPNSTSDFIKVIICANPTEQCYYQTCNSCENLKNLQIVVENSEKNLDEDIKLFQWMKDENNALAKQKICLSINEAFEKLKGKLPQFLQHAFIKQQQEIFFESFKSNMQPNVLLLHFDFSENYSFFSQDEIQSAHWVSKSCTIYTAMAYFIYENNLKSVPIVVISDYLHHDKYAVAIFNNAIIKKIKDDFSELSISKIIYKSDGTAQHFKQKYSICLAMLQSNDIEWHFAATGHGKGPIDGVGGTLKRRVREATLSRKINISRAEEFSKSAEQICKNITILYIPESKIQAGKNQLDQLCCPTGSEIFAIPNTRKFHSFIKIDDYILKASNVSLNPKQYIKFNMKMGESEDMKMSENEERKMSENDKKKIGVEMCEKDSPVEIHKTKIGNWILVPFSGKCKVKHFAGQVLDKEKNLIKVKFLQKKGNCFIWPLKEDISYINLETKTRILPEPNFDRRGCLTFDNFDFSSFIVG
nr:uncharacterized protein LOC122273608 [Parasteatoda tepidariorum]